MSSVNANLYAYDFVKIDAEGRLFRHDLNRKQNWLSFASPVYSRAEIHSIMPLKARD